MIVNFSDREIFRRTKQVKDFLITDFGLPIEQLGEIEWDPQIDEMMDGIPKACWSPKAFVHELEQFGLFDDIYEKQAEACGEWG